MRALAIAAVAACGPAPAGAPDAPPDAPCPVRCSDDLTQLLGCNDEPVAACDGATVCDPATSACINACADAEARKLSIGCDYYATSMDVFQHGNCFAAVVANTWPAPAHLAVTRKGVSLPVASFTRIPVGSGAALTFAPYDAAAGLPPGQVAIVFLGGATGAAPKCPIASAAEVSSFPGTGLGDAFELATDVPVVAYQINPFGGGSAAITGASLLLPTSVWDTSYVAVSAAASGAPKLNEDPSFNIIAREDGTLVTITPTAGTAITGGNGIPAGATGQAVDVMLAKGQHAQLTQIAELTGAKVTANKPIGVMAGHQCMRLPAGAFFCDHAEQMLPPVRALGSKYAGVMYRPRVATETMTTWRLVGAVDGTALAYAPAAVGPASLRAGESVTFQTGIPFTVQSQDAQHPFVLFEYMSSSGALQTTQSGFGDPDFVLAVTPEQWLDRYVFFTDPTYPETDLVVTRARATDGQFHDVTLDCAGALTGWTAIGADVEFTRVDLTTGDFANVGNCSTGRREMSSTAPFGLTVWGWGTPTTTIDTRNVSYGYPGGMNVAPINNVIF